jgi:hypothetical protein
MQSQRDNLSQKKGIQRTPYQISKFKRRRRRRRRRSKKNKKNKKIIKKVEPVKKNGYCN